MFGDSTSQKDADKTARFECGICWWVYDPALGLPEDGYAVGTALVDLPEHWVCPQCEAPKHKFMPLADGA